MKLVVRDKLVQHPVVLAVMKEKLLFGKQPGKHFVFEVWFAGGLHYGRFNEHPSREDVHDDGALVAVRQDGFVVLEAAEPERLYILFCCDLRHRNDVGLAGS